MNTDLTKQLISKYSQFFQDVNKPPTQTCMCWGCECGDGWFDILDNLCREIMESGPPEHFKFAQVKEKFGGLRVYVFGSTEEISRLIHDAERASYKICEGCGSKENVVSDWICGWVRTICKSCAVRDFGEEAEKIWNPTEPSGD